MWSFGGSFATPIGIIVCSITTSAGRPRTCAQLHETLSIGRRSIIAPVEPVPLAHGEMVELRQVLELAGAEHGRTGAHVARGVFACALGGRCFNRRP
jgi:hypothetical protein